MRLRSWRVFSIELRPGRRLRLGCGFRRCLSNRFLSRLLGGRLLRVRFLRGLGFRLRRIWLGCRGRLRF